MNEPTHTEAMKTDLPSPKPNRRKQLVLRFAVLVAAVSVLGAAYWFTRPPELVWWRSPTIVDTQLNARILMPQGWGLEEVGFQQEVFNEPGRRFEICLKPIDKMPRF